MRVEALDDVRCTPMFDRTRRRGVVTLIEVLKVLRFEDIEHVEEVVTTEAEEGWRAVMFGRGAAVK